MTLETWLAFLLAAGANVLTPGPAIALAIRNSLSEGLGRTLYSTAGNVAAIGCVGLAVSLGLGALINSHPGILTGLRLVGGSYLIWLAIKAWRGGIIRLEEGGKPERATLKGRHLFLQSLMVGLTNPKMLAFLIALFPLFLDPNTPIAGQLATMTGTFMTLSFLALSCFALAASQFAKLIRQPAILARINRVVALIFFTFGASLILAGLNQLQDGFFQ